MKAEKQKIEHEYKREKEAINVKFNESLSLSEVFVFVYDCLVFKSIEDENRWVSE